MFQTTLFAFHGNTEQGQSSAQGKSTCAQVFAKVLAQEFQQECELVRFAERLKKGLPVLFDVESKYFEDPNLKEVLIPELNVSARNLMQQGGAFVGVHLPLAEPAFSFSLPSSKKNDKMSFFTNATQKKLKQVMQEGKKIAIVDDLRFQDEAALIHLLGGIIFSVERTSLEEEEKKKIPTTTTTTKRKKKPSTKKNKKRKRNVAFCGARKLPDIQAHYKLVNNGTVADLEDLFTQFLKSTLIDESMDTLMVNGASLTKLDIVVPKIQKKRSLLKMVNPTPIKSDDRNERQPGGDIIMPELESAPVCSPEVTLST